MSKYEINGGKKLKKNGRWKYNYLPKPEYMRVWKEYQENFYRDFDPKDMRPMGSIPVMKPARDEEYYAKKGTPLVYNRYEGVEDGEIVEYDLGGKNGEIILLPVEQARKKAYERALKIAYQKEINHNVVKQKLGASVGHRLVCDMPMERRIGRIEGIPHTKVPKKLVRTIERRYKEMAKNNPALPKEKSFPVENKVFADGGKLMADMNEIVMRGMKNQGKLMSYPTPDDLQMECQMFLVYCQERQVVPTLPMLMQWLGLTKSQFDKYLALGNAHSEVLEFMVGYMHAFTLDKAMNGQVHHMLYIYLSKNWWGMSDKVEQTITTVNTGLDGMDKDVVLQSIKDLPVVDADFDEWDEDDYE